MLLIPGHPALERAAADVLGAGDAGLTYLPWPGSAAPLPSNLEARSRERFHVEHGRIDSAGQPRPVYLPLLRVGAMIRYEASLAHRFQEQEEAWVDARTGLGLPVGVLEALRGSPRLPEPDARHARLAGDLPLAVHGAHAALEARAAARADALLAQGRRALQAELVRADAYYAGALDSIERRRASAPADRARLLDDQAEATRAEHARRRREIEEQYRPRHELRPFRLHIAMAPAFLLSVEIRRGPRAYPFECAWLALGAEFADLRCPHCDAAAELVAGRERLGCRECMTRQGASGGRRGPAEARAAERAPGQGRVSGSGGRGSALSERAKPASAGESAAPRSKPGRRPPPAARRRLAAERRRDRRGAPKRLERAGNKLALDLWQCVADGERWPRKRVARHSPLGAIYRLYGAEGPMCALGVPPGEVPAEVTAATYDCGPGAPVLTNGEIKVGSDHYTYWLSWWLEAGRPVVAEVMPTPTPMVPAPAERDDVAANLGEDAPQPLIRLDPVAAELWRVELPATGLPMTARCLATRWRVGEAADSLPPAAGAAAVAHAVSRAAGLRRPSADAAAAFGVEQSLLNDAARALASQLRLDRLRGW